MLYTYKVLEEIRRDFITANGGQRFFVLCYGDHFQLNAPLPDRHECLTRVVQVDSIDNEKCVPNRIAKFVLGI